MTHQQSPETLDDMDLELAGGVYIQEIPSGAKDRRAGHGMLLAGWDDAAVDRPETGWAVFEPNNER